MRAWVGMMTCSPRALFTFVCLCTATMAPASPSAPDEASIVIAGLRNITLPPPAGFVRCDGINKDFDARMAGFLPPGNRMLAYYASREDQDNIRNGTGGRHARSLNLQVAWEVENMEIGERTFAGSRDALKKGM